MEDPYEAFCLDQAISFFGNSVEAKLDEIHCKTEAETKKRRQARLQQYIFPDEKPQSSGFADPAAFFS